LVILGNLIGGVLFTLFISLLAPHLNLFTHETMVGLLLSAIVAGWLMGLLMVNKQRQKLTNPYFLIL
jgi:formate/nitrite transporter FocA (FNT family)